MTYREFTHGRIKLDELHAEADADHLASRIHRRRLGALLRKLASIIDHA